MSVESKIRALVRRLQDGDQSAFEPLAFLLLPKIDAGIEGVVRSAERIEDPDSIKDKVVGQFLDNKLQSETFWAQLLERDSPLALVRVAAGNLTRTEVGKLPQASRLVVGADAQELDNKEEGADQALLRQEAATSAFEDIHALELKERVLLYVLYAEHIDLPPAEFEWLVNERGVPKAQLEQELDARSAAQARARRKVAERIERKISNLQGLHNEVAQCWAVIRKLDGQRSAASEMSRDRREKLRRSNRALEEASAEERSSLLMYLEARREKVAAELVGLRTEKRERLPAGQLYAEVAVIMGLAPADDEAAIKRAVSTVTKRSRRLMAKLKAARVRRRRDE